MQFGSRNKHLAILRRLRTGALAGAAMTLLGAATIAPAGADSFERGKDANWVASWTSPTGGTSLLVTVSNQTIRQVVHLSRGGDRIRIRIDNLNGNGAPAVPGTTVAGDVTIGAATVAVKTPSTPVACNLPPLPAPQGPCPAWNAVSYIEPGTARALTFGGLPSVTLPIGGTVYSDPVDLRTDDLSDVAVDFYFPDITILNTSHFFAQQTEFFSAPGNHNGEVVLPLAPSTPTATSTYMLTAVDVRADEKSWAIVAIGDSITDGTASTTNANHRWPNFLAKRILGDFRQKDIAVVDAGIGGNRVLHGGSDPTPFDSPTLGHIGLTWGQAAIARFDRDVLAQTGVGFVIVYEGVNDLGVGNLLNQNVSADEIIQGYRNLIARAHDRCIKIIGATVTPFHQNSGFYTPELESKRQAMNGFIRNSREFDGVIDFDAVVRDPSNPTMVKPGLSPDGVHFYDTGYQMMANAIDLRLFRDSIDNMKRNGNDKCRAN
jgi:lysophospholipase L1-like esterase